MHLFVDFDAGKTLRMPYNILMSAGTAMQRMQDEHDRLVLEKNNDLKTLKANLENTGVLLRRLKSGELADQLYKAINLTAEEDKDHYLVRIADTGCGISRKNLKKIFNPFFTTREKGTGLGLSIVGKIIEGHKGTIALDSKEGRGTEVKIRLPRKA